LLIRLSQFCSLIDAATWFWPLPRSKVRPGTVAVLIFSPEDEAFRRSNRAFERGDQNDIACASAFRTLKHLILAICLIQVIAILIYSPSLRPERSAFDGDLAPAIIRGRIESQINTFGAINFSCF
jgi:hypothetical protein